MANLMEKVLHIFSDSPYAAKFIEFTNKNFDSSNHTFLILCLKKDSQFLSTYQKIDNCKVLFNKNIYFKNVASFKMADQIIVHQLNKPALMASLLLFYPSAFQKMVWVLWGGDVYLNARDKPSLKEMLLEKLRCIVISKLPLMVSYLKGDYEHIVRNYDTKAEYLKADYTSFITKNQVEQIQSSIQLSSSTIIVVGNSADPSNEHLQVFGYLEKFKDENIIIQSLLSYGGNKTYIETVKKEGRLTFGEKYQPIENYMTFDEYLKFMAESDICIFNHKRQQGLGNLKVFFALQKKVFISEVTSPYAYFQRIGLAINSTERIKNLSFDEFKGQTKSTSIQNRDIMLNEINERNIVSDWQQVFNKAIK